MKDILYMAWRYLRFHRVKTIVLVASIGLIIFLPSGLQVLATRSAEMLNARAEATPLLIGSRGSAVDLTLNALYFQSPHVDTVEYREATRLNGGDLARGIPLHTRYVAGRQRIVGTTMDYASFRGLTLDRGRWMAILGECVLGSNAAKELGVDVGDRILSSAGSAFDVAGSFPLKMPVVGVLEARGTADDDIVLVDIKTAWVIEGLAHGHENVSAAGADDLRVMRRDESNIVANSSVLIYTEITTENIDSFHFHGDSDDFPIDVVLVIPKDFKSSVMLRGQYEDRDADVQVVVPTLIMDELIATMFSVRSWIVVGGMLVGFGTVMTAILVFVLSIRLRRREIETIRKIGGGRRRLAMILALEILIIVVMAMILAGILTGLVSRFGESAVRILSAGSAI